MDDLTRIKGIGPAAAKKLAAAGIDTFEKLAHDGLAGQHGVKVEWIVEAAELLHAGTDDEYQGQPLRLDDGTDGRAEAPAVPADGGAGDPHEITPEREDRGGGDGDPAVPAREDAPIMPTPLVLNLVRTADTAAAPAPEWPLDAPQAGPGDVDEPEAYPLLAAAVVAWTARGENRAPLVRIAAKRDGFRRCGLAHSKVATDHEIGRFSPAELELLLAEPMLTVELV